MLLAAHFFLVTAHPSLSTEMKQHPTWKWEQQGDTATALAACSDSPRTLKPPLAALLLFQGLLLCFLFCFLFRLFFVLFFGHTCSFITTRVSSSVSTLFSIKYRGVCTLGTVLCLPQGCSRSHSQLHAGSKPPNLPAPGWTLRQGPSTTRLCPRGTDQHLPNAHGHPQQTWPCHVFNCL